MLFVLACRFLTVFSCLTDITTNCYFQIEGMYKIRKDCFFVAASLSQQNDSLLALARILQ